MAKWCCGKLVEDDEAENCCCGTGTSGAGQTSGCMVCGKPLVYERGGKNRVCAVCGKSVWSHEECEDGHFVCDACHGAAAGTNILELLSETPERSPSVLMESLWRQPAIHTFGPEHHWLVPAVLLTAYRNCGGEIDLNAALTTAWQRGKQVSGGSCGYWGACGAAIGMGIYFSILYGSSPVHPTVWALPQRLTAKCLETISDYAGPRCCKRTCRMAMEVAAKYTVEQFHVTMPIHWSPCGYTLKNAECMGEACPYFRKDGGHI